jgi:hypothetical protein
MSPRPTPTKRLPLHHHLHHASRLGEIILGNLGIENGKLIIENY